jgi:hypothetical protein
MIRKPALSAEKYAALDELVRLGSIAVKNAQDASRRLGVPNVYSINGRLYYETSEGHLSATDPGIGRTEPISDGPESPTGRSSNG